MEHYIKEMIQLFKGISDKMIIILDINLNFPGNLNTLN